MNILSHEQVIIAVVGLMVLLNVVSLWLPPKAKIPVILLAAVASLVWLSPRLSTGQTVLLVSIGVYTYLVVSELFDREQWELREHLLKKIQDCCAVEIVQARRNGRLAADIGLTGLGVFGAVWFLAVAPDNYAPFKMFSIFMIISVLPRIIERIVHFYSSRFYWLPDTERLVVVSRFQPRDFSLRDLKDVSVWSSPDLLKLHPLFRIMSSYRDYTRTFGKVLILSFPTETICLTPDQADEWYKRLAPFSARANEAGNVTAGSADQNEKTVKPLWHPSTLGRLFWKGYYLATVKGVSAYSGCLAFLIWLKAPGWVIFLFIVSWWLVNLFVSDRLLIAAVDAEPITDGEVFSRAQRIFNRAGISGTRLYTVDSADYNGLATGMNIGRGAVILTTATLRLPPESIEAIVAHEAAHIRKRDVLWLQLARAFLIGGMAGGLYFFWDELRLLAQDYKIAVFFVIYLLMMIFSMYTSFVSQWTEVRADFTGAAWLEGGTGQMARGLRDLAVAQELDIERAEASRTIGIDSTEHPAGSGTDTSEPGRDPWFFRVLGFQFMLHPPLYWRINTLFRVCCWRQARKRWLIDRFRESLPF